MALRRFCEYLGMNPDEIIEAYKAALKADVNEAVEEWNDKLDLFVPWLVDKYKIKRSVAAARFGAIKSFFGYTVANGLTTKTPAYHSESLQPTSIDDLREQILPFANVLTRFEILFLKDSGISQDDALRLNVGDLEDLGNGFGHIRMFRAKEGVDYETFIGPNAMDAMRTALDYRKRLGHKITNESPLFVKPVKMDKRDTPSSIQYALNTVSKKAGIKLSTHRFRKTFETYMAVGRVHPIILKYWMGHKVKHGKADIEVKYIIPPKPEQIKLYMEAYKYIDINPQPDQTELLLAETRTRMASLPPEQRKRFLKEIITAYCSRAHTIMSDAKIKELLKEKATRTNGGSTDCQKIVSEEELETHLAKGWRVQAVLPSGKIVISSE